MSTIKRKKSKDYPLSIENVRIGERDAGQGFELSPIDIDGVRLLSGYEEFLTLPEEERRRIEAADTDELREKVADFVAEQQRQRSIIGPSYWD